jgi:hypothetical protein
MSLLLSTVLLGALTVGQTPAVAELDLLDQHGVADRLADHSNRIVVVMVVTARRLRNLKGLERDLHERYEDLKFIRIADVPDDPPVTREEVADKLNKRVPEEVPILIDIERRWARELELDTERPNVLLFDRDGRFVAAFRGRAEPELLDEIHAALDELTGRP